MNALNILPLDLPNPENFSAQTKKLIKCIGFADTLTSNVDHLGASAGGFTSPKIRCLLNNLVSYPDTRYMEIGVYHGATLISALYKNNPEYHVAIDLIGGDDLYTFNSNCRRILGKEANLISGDCWKIDPLERGINNINVYFYDGDHSQESTRKAFTHYYPCLANEFIVLVDDWLRPEVATGVLEGMRDVGLKYEFAKILPARASDDDANWWSGLFVASCTK